MIYTFEDFKQDYLIPKDKLKHAYLVETNNIDLTLDKLVKTLLSINNDTNKYNDVFTGDYKDLAIINSNTRSILKENIVDLKNDMQKSSLKEGNLRFYIIEDADKLSATTSNIMLKFLEEPPKDVIAFFLVKNEYLVLDTIISRCIPVKIIEDVKMSELANKFVNNIYQNKELFLIKMDSEMRDTLENGDIFKQILNECIHNEKDNKLKEAFIKAYDLVNNYTKTKIVLEKINYYIFGGSHE